MENKFEIKTFSPDGKDQLYAWVIAPSGAELEIMFQEKEFWEWVEKEDLSWYPNEDDKTGWYDNAEEMIKDDKEHAHFVLEKYFTQHVFKIEPEYATDK